MQSKWHTTPAKYTISLVHTGHYDQKMNDTFFTELNIPEPDANLGCGGDTYIMITFEKDAVLLLPCITLPMWTRRRS